MSALTSLATAPIHSAIGTYNNAIAQQGEAVVSTLEDAAQSVPIYEKLV